MLLLLMVLVFFVTIGLCRHCLQIIFVAGFLPPLSPCVRRLPDLFRIVLGAPLPVRDEVQGTDGTKEQKVQNIPLRRSFTNSRS